MIVIQHMPDCGRALAGLPCDCSRTELADPPTNRPPELVIGTCGHYHYAGNAELCSGRRYSGSPEDRP